MFNTIKRNAPTWVFNLFLAVAFYAYTSHIRATAQEELKGYVPRDQFNQYATSHEDTNVQIIKRYDSDIAEIKQALRDIQAELMRRPGPPRPPFQP